MRSCFEADADYKRKKNYDDQEENNNNYNK